MVLVSLLACLLATGAAAGAGTFFLELAGPCFPEGTGVEAVGLGEGGSDVGAACCCGGSGLGCCGGCFGARNCITAMPMNTSRKANSSFFSPPGSFLGS